MKEKRKIIVAFFALITKEDKVLIIRRASHDSGGGFWDFPGGGARFGEKPKNTLLREIKEETRLEVNIEKIIDVAGIYPPENKNIFIYLITYLCNYKSGKVKLSKDHDGFKWIKPRDITKYKSLSEIKRIIKKYLDKKYV